MKTTPAAPEEQDFVISSLSPSQAQKRLALGVVLALLVAFFITAGPLSTIQLGRIDAFVPAYATALFVIDSITAVLLFAQFSILRSRALLAIASGYLFTALIVIPWMLTFPGVFTPSGLLGAGLQTTNWLYILWHAGFPTFVIAYALLKDADPTKGCGGGPRVRPFFQVWPRPRPSCVRRHFLSQRGMRTCPAPCSTRSIFLPSGFMLPDIKSF